MPFYHKLQQIGAIGPVRGMTENDLERFRPIRSDCAPADPKLSVEIKIIRHQFGMHENLSLSFDFNGIQLEIIAGTARMTISLSATSTFPISRT